MEQTNPIQTQDPAIPNGRHIEIVYRKEEPIMFTAKSPMGLVVPAMVDWREAARKIVAYPEDYGMSRQDVRGLERMLVERQPAEVAPAPRAPRLRLIRRGPAVAVRGFTPSAA